MSLAKFIRADVFPLIALLLLVISPAAFSEPDSTPPTATEAQVFDVFKSPTCGCCSLWVDHMQANGIDSRIHHPDDLNAVKNKHQIAPQYRSCHTAVSAEGYVFEGHIPARLIKRFLAEKPEGAIGLAVPGMPAGSPGMEMGDRITPYDVLLLKADGSTRVYERVTTLETPNTI